MNKTVNMTPKNCNKILTENVFPAIRKKWSGRKSKAIQAQQDNAGSHISPFGMDIVAAGEGCGWNIEIINWPPRSLDLKGLNFGVFHSLQSLQLKQASTNIDDSMFAVKRSFDRLTPAKIKNVCYTSNGDANHHFTRR
ncbi:hypothetical protein JG687_00015485 [Phytophthora cactorum]|uniref:Uncharacterized protein n=1 Tax=Phytophthora cactorum TaxID=29920 RepID=A0A8T1TXU8_9STRA|nr:hypothetical protein JG687_00015485 [Phytophthora cactorum]